jgi:hypothetical protein
MHQGSGARREMKGARDVKRLGDHCSSVVIEGALAYAIRDNFTLNIIMLIYPFEAIKQVAARGLTVDHRHWGAGSIGIRANSLERTGCHARAGPWATCTVFLPPLGVVPINCRTAFEGGLPCFT